MPLNITNIKTSSDGAWQGDNPLNYAFPLLIVQIILVLLVTRFLAFLLKPLRQPRVISEILGGILLGPSALGRNKDFFGLLFPSWSTPILESVASIGLLFFLFLVGLELDLRTIRQSSKVAFGIAIAGISLPFLFSIGLSFILRKAIHGEEHVAYGQYLVFMGVSLSITAFPVLARILAELKLLTTQIGQTAMAAAAFNDVAAWILLALAVALAGGDSKSPLTSIWVLISGVAFVAFMMAVIRPLMNWVARKCSQQPDFLDEAYICMTLAGVMLAGFFTDLIGIHSIFGAFVFGLTIPKGGEFAGKLTIRIEDFVSGLVLPLYFASSGLKTDVGKIQGLEAWGLLLLVISTSCAGKILGTFVVATLCTVPARESLALGVLMNTKGLVELIVLNIGKEKKVLNDEIFAILVLMAIFTTFMTTPTVMAIYKPTSRMTQQVERQSAPISHSQPDQPFRIMGCVYGPQNVKPLVDLINTITNTKISSVKLYIMHLVKLTDRSSSIMMVQRTRKNGFPFINRFRQGRAASNDQIEAAVEAYSRCSRLKVRYSTSVSLISTMHEDICHVAEDKSVGMIILPSYKQWREGGEGDGWMEINQNVLRNASCTIGFFVDRGLGAVDHDDGAMSRKVCILLFGGPDDQKALELGLRMVQNPDLSITLIRFKGPSNNFIQEESDEIVVEELRRKSTESLEYIEKVLNNAEEQVTEIGDFDLFVVGRRAKMEETPKENHELGVIGDILASSKNGSLLIIQQNKPQITIGSKNSRDKAHIMDNNNCV